jgi:hypothetical protein
MINRTANPINAATIKTKEEEEEESVLNTSDLISCFESLQAI